MISVIITKPEKLSGLYSCRVSFPYNENILGFIHNLSGPCIFLKKQLLWEIPIYNLSDFLDEAVFYDSIDLKIDIPEIRQISNSPLSETEVESFIIKPFKHQIEAVNFGLSHAKWLNLSGMGLGKTCEATYLAETLHNRGLVEKCLIICGVDSLRQNWKSEILKFSKLPVRVLGEKLTKKGTTQYDTLPARARELREPIDAFFTITNITNVGDDNFVEAFKKSANKFDMIIVDEVHRCTKGSQRGNNLLKLDAKYKVALTGTLILNSPLSAYLPLAWTENDKANLSTFKNQYCNFGGFGGHQIVGYKNLELLNDEIKSCSLRRTFAEVRGDMPKKTVEYEIVEMDSAHSKFYEAIKNGIKEEADKIELNANNLLALMTRLRQATSAPSVLTSTPVESTKLLRAVELAEDILESGEKVIIMSTFKEPVYTLATKLQQFRPIVCTGDQKEDLVQKDIETFRNSKDFNLLIGTHGKIGTGFSMPECHMMIMIDTPYTAAALDQSCDRIYRITSDQPVYIKILCCKNTVDERVREIVEDKKDLSDYMIDGKPNSKFTNELKNIILNL